MLFFVFQRRTAANAQPTPAKPNNHTKTELIRQMNAQHPTSRNQQSAYK